MHLELAKELQNAGFPNIQDLQHRQGREFLTPDGRVCFYSLGELAPAEYWFIPSLEELIEACQINEGYNDFSLAHRELGWFASIAAQDEQPYRVSHQATAEDAVARLWLALEKRRHGTKSSKYFLPDGELGRGLVEALMSSVVKTVRKHTIGTRKEAALDKKSIAVRGGGWPSRQMPVAEGDALGRFY